MVLAWRAWALEDQWVPSPVEIPHAHASGWRLISVGNDSEYSMWLPNERPKAECLLGHTGRVDPHEAPDPDCRCGYYAYKSLEACLLAYDFSHAPPEVVGQVALEGRIIRMQETYRAQFAHPVNLEVLDLRWRDVPRKARELEVYGVPVQVRASPEVPPEF